MCTLEKRGSVFILSLAGPGEHRLNPSLISDIRSALRRVSSDPSCTALITTADGKFFSNGYDLSWAQNIPNRLRILSSDHRALVADLISLPMPTIAAVTGHASAAGLILALSHDYLLMRKDRGFLYMSEMDINLVVPAWFMALIETRIGLPAARRELIMRAAKLTGKKGVALGIVDSVHDGAVETVSAAVRLGEELAARKWNGQVYADNRLVVFRNVLKSLGSDETVQAVEAVPASNNGRPKL